MWLLGVVCCFVAGMCEVRRGGFPTLSVNYSGEGIEGGDVRGGGGRIFFIEIPAFTYISQSLPLKQICSVPVE